MDTRLSWLVGAACFAGSTGCWNGMVEVETTTRFAGVPIGFRTEQGLDRTRPLYGGSMSVTEDGKALLVQTFRFDRCTTTPVYQVDRTEVTVREVERGSIDWRYLDYIGGGIAGVGGAVTIPVSLHSGDAGGVIFGTMGGITLACIGLPLLIMGVANSASLMDTEEHVGEVELRGPAEQKPCREERAAAPFAIRIGKAIIEDQTDDNGDARIPLDEVEAAFRRNKKEGPKASLEILGHTRDISDALRPLFKAWKQQAKDADEEIRTGRCTDARVAELRKAEAALRPMLEGESQFRVEAHQLILATNAGAPVAFEAPSAGEQHIFVVGFDPVQITIAGDGATVTKSPQHAVVGGSAWRDIDSRVVITSEKTVAFAVKGAGCALALLVRKL